MAKTFFSADYHFFHANCLEYDHRPFKNVYEMNDTIIRKHNEKVKEDDTMFFLGDLIFYASKNASARGEGEPCDSNDVLKQMNGKQWYFVKGNHEKSSNKFNSKVESMVLNQNGLRIQLLHDSLYARIEYDLILCGHHHNTFKIKELNYLGQTRLIINVGVMLWDYYPVSLDEVLAIYYRWKKERQSIQRWEHPAIIKELNKGCLNGQ